MSEHEVTCNVAVLGAGFAGLAAARAIVDATSSGAQQQRVVVLEARERVGGRVFTTTLPDGTWVDLGGQWLGAGQERLAHYLSRYRLDTYKTWTAGDNVLLWNGKRTLYRGTIPKLPLTALLSVAWAQFRLDRMAKQVPLQAPWQAKSATEWDSQSFGSWLKRNVSSDLARQLLSIGMETVFAEHADNYSLLHALFYIHSGKNTDTLLGSEGGAQETRVSGGMQRLAEAMSQGLDVRLQTPVRRVQWSADGAVVHCDGLVVHAEQVILTLPPPLLKEVVFEPPLPPSRQALHEGMPMGAAGKCVAVYDEPFWRKNGLSGMCVSDEGPCHVTFDSSPPEGKPGVLLGFVEADGARALGKLTESERRQRVLACFAKYFGEEARNPRSYVDKLWEQDPWAHGCYGAFCPPGLLTTHGSALREPIGTLHFAGTETATVWSGYIDGALSSGERAASEVLAHSSKRVTT